MEGPPKSALSEARTGGFSSYLSHLRYRKIPSSELTVLLFLEMLGGDLIRAPREIFQNLTENPSPFSSSVPLLSPHELLARTSWQGKQSE